MTNKLVVIINSPKLPKIKKLLLYEMKFIVPNYGCLQNPWLWGYCPPDPHSLCPLSSTEFVEPLPNKIPGYATGTSRHLRSTFSELQDTGRGAWLLPGSITAVNYRWTESTHKDLLGYRRPGPTVTAERPIINQTPRNPSLSSWQRRLKNWVNWLH